MTNKFKHIAMILVLAGFAMLPTACNKDDNNSSSIKGWYFTQTEYISNWDGYGTTVGQRQFIHIITDNYLEWDNVVDYGGDDFYSSSLEEHSGWYYGGGHHIGHNFVRDGDLLVCDNGDTYSIDGNILRGGGYTYYKE